MIEQSQRHAAKIFGITYLLSLLVIGVAFSRFYAPYLVWENGEETARRFITHERSIRMYLAGAFFYGAAIIVQLTALYVILRQVNRGIALFALRLMGGAGSLRTVGPDGLAALAGSQLDSSRDAYYIGMVFNALGLALFASVFFQSRYIPRALALWGVLTSLYEAFCGLAYLFYPNFGTILSVNWYEYPLMSFELLLTLWLLFRGLRSPNKHLAIGQC